MEMTESHYTSKERKVATKQQIEQNIAQMEEKLDETVSGLDRGPVRDAVRVVVPMMKDQLALMRSLLDAMMS
jgi:hypothetical protein